MNATNQVSGCEAFDRALRSEIKASPGGASESVGRDRRLRVLYAEDDPLDAELGLGQLRDAGFEISADVVGSRREFEAALRTKPYDIVLADYSMPAWSGVEALEILQREQVEVPFIVVTGAVGDEVAADLIKKGAADFILKDRPARLPSAVERALEEKTSRDERKLAEETLRASETRYHRLFETAQDGILLLAETGVVADANPFLLQMLGYAKSEIVGRRLHEIGFVVDDELCLNTFRTLERGGDVRYDGLPLRTCSGKRIDVEFASKAYQAGEEKVIQCNIRDVSERKRIEEELKRTLRMKEDFVNFAMHQLRTPLGGIKWLLELAARRKDLPAEVVDFMQDAHAAAQRLIDIVNDLLSIARLENGKLRVELRETNLAELTASALEDVGYEMTQRGHQATVSGADDVPTVRVDRQLFRQVIANLISNAVKYTEPGGRIRIEMKSRDGVVCWAITDNGIGISTEAQRRVFEKFFRADNAHRLDTEGTGLGLCLARLIVERFGGKLSFESEEGKGSTFAVTIPLGSSGEVGGGE